MKATFFQACRFAIVGILSNSFGYILYLLMTSAGMGHKLAMTILFAAGTAQTFFFNKKWSFAYKEHDDGALLRYVATYVLGYLVNLGALLFFVDVLGMQHAIVQVTMIFVVALLMFLLQKFWVFPARPKQPIYSESAL